MKSWLALAFLGFALVQSVEVTKCPTYCDCVVSGEATCNTLGIEPFPNDDIHHLTIKAPKDHLDLTGPTFTSLRLTNLKELTIINATISKLDASLFSNIHLERFVVRNSKIPSINKQHFKASQYIRLIDISRSEIKVFEGIHSPVLDELILADCNMEKIPSGSLSPRDLPALSYISLENNRIQDVKLGEIAGEQINLAGNKITNLKIASTEDLDRLVTLRLDNNPLNTIDIDDDVDIEELYVKSCELTNLNFLKYFSALTKLDASNNLIFKLDAKILNNLDALEALYLSENLLRELPKDFGRVMSLTKLVLDGNNLETLPEFVFQGALDNFSCNNCNLTKLHPKTFDQMRDTRIISLAWNKLSSIPSNLFKPVVAMVKVDLSNNLLTSLPSEIFEHNIALKNVDISNNPLKLVSPVIFSKTALQELHMDSCNLQQLWNIQILRKVTLISMLPKLDILTASHNNISKLTSDDMLVAKVATLNLQDNPLACTDNNIKFINVMTEMGAEFLHSADCDLLKNDSDEEDDNDDDTEYDDIDPEVHPDNSEEIEVESKKAKPEATKKASDNMLFEDEYDDENYDEYLKANEEADEDIKIPSSKKKAYFGQAVDDVMAIERRLRFPTKQTSSKQMLLFVLPTLVFVLTAMVVLLLTVTIILCVLQKRNGRPTNAPQITILPWGHSQKIKKHSGSIYRPLSEEKIPV